MQTAPCLIGYGHVGARLLSSTPGVTVNSNPDLNPYWGWIREYGGEWYQGCVKSGIGALASLPFALPRSQGPLADVARLHVQRNATELLEQTLAKSPVSAQRLDELARIFTKATELEIAFWDAAVEAGKKTRDEVMRHEGLPV